jgi:predicted ribosomally synthesized peptide with nif11-like leader
MSKENLQAFAEAVSRSRELQKQLAAIQTESARSTAEKLAKLSESAGTPFTAEEYLKAVAESSEEISEEQLQSVAGGAGNPDKPKLGSLAPPFGTPKPAPFPYGPEHCNPEWFPGAQG